MKCRLIFHAPSDGVWNMAVDQALLDACQTTGQPVVRFYQWQQPTLSLGYFQKHAERLQHAESQSCTLVRRSTGGGAIIHDFELTYSLILPELLVPRPWNRVYQLIHNALVNLLQSAGLRAELHPEPTRRNPTRDKPTLVQEGGSVSPEPFLCFLRRSVGDVIVWPAMADDHNPIGKKVVGSAQRKLGHCLLQHGSILLAKSATAPQLLGINDLLPASAKLEMPIVQNCVTSQLESHFGWHTEDSQLTSHEEELAEHYRTSRFSNNSWTYSR